MHLSRNTSLIFSFVAVLMALSVSTATASASEESGFFYYYFDQAMPLDLDQTRIAFQSASGDDITMTDTLEELGFDTEEMERVRFGGWAIASLPARSSGSNDTQARVASLASSGKFAFVSPVFIDNRGLPMLITSRLLVGFREDVTPEQAERILTDNDTGAIIQTDFAGLPNVYLIESESRNGFEVLAQANQLAILPEVVFAESDAVTRGTTSVIPNDPYFDDQWALQQSNDFDLDAPEAWDVTTGDPNIIVVVLDIGIQQDHPDLNQIPGQDFSGSIPGGGPETQCDNHGTAVAGCISAIMNNGTGVAGVAPNCLSASAKIGTAPYYPFIGCALGFFDSQPSMLANGIDWAVTIGARVTNSSIGVPESATITTAYNNARANGVIHFAATGNSGDSSISYPATLASVNAVGAINASGTRASFSQYGTGIAFCAPGENIWTADRTGMDGYAAGDYTEADGTSFASPYAAGVAALIISQSPYLTPAEVEQAMINTAHDLGSSGYDTTYGHGLVNAYDAVLSVTTYDKGDYNHDGSVNLDDYANWEDCMTDPDNSPYDSGCEAFDFDDDLDVDLEDFTLLTEVFDS